MCHLSCYPLKPHAQTPIFIPGTSCPINFPMHKFVPGSEFMVVVSGNRTACNYSKSHEAWDLTALHKVSLKFCLIIVWSILQAHHIHQSCPTFLALRTSQGRRRDGSAGAVGKHACAHSSIYRSDGQALPLFTQWSVRTFACPLCKWGCARTRPLLQPNSEGPR